MLVKAQGLCQTKAILRTIHVAEEPLVSYTPIATQQHNPAFGENALMLPRYMVLANYTTEN